MGLSSNGHPVTNDQTIKDPTSPAVYRIAITGGPCAGKLQ